MITGSLFYNAVVIPTWLIYIFIGYAAFQVVIMLYDTFYRIFRCICPDKAPQGDAGPPNNNKVGVSVNEHGQQVQGVYYYHIIRDPNLLYCVIYHVVILSLSVVAIFLGLLFTSVNVPVWITYIMMAFCLFHVCVEFILEIHQCCMYDKNRGQLIFGLLLFARFLASSFR